VKTERYGIILNVHAFDECVAFYRDLFELPVLFTKTDGDFRLTCLALGDAYLMIETGGVSLPGGKDVSQNPVKLRFNVPDIAEAHRIISDYGIDTDIIETDWGSIISINDPDGNPISIRDHRGFRNDLDASR
jgi:lactoylglutathione lyase